MKKKQNLPIENKLDEVEEKSCRENCTKVLKSCKKREKKVGKFGGKVKKVGKEIEEQKLRNKLWENWDN